MNTCMLIRLAYIENNDNKTLGKKLSYDAGILCNYKMNDSETIFTIYYNDTRRTTA